MRLAALESIGRAVAQEDDERRDQAAAHDLDQMLLDFPRKTLKRVHCVLLIVVCAVKYDRNQRRDSLLYEASYLLYPTSE